MRAECAARCDGCGATTLDKYSSEWIEFLAEDTLGKVSYIQAAIGSRQIGSPLERLNFCTLHCIGKFLEKRK